MNQLSFENAKILVVGDIMLDVYRYGKASRISPEAPVPIVLISREENKAGGAANVVINLKQLGCGIVNLIGYVGDDYACDQLIGILRENGINHDNIYHDLIVSRAPTITKTRILANGQHVIRCDEDSAFNTSSHRKTYEDMLIQRLNNLSCKRSFDVVIISDYAKGTITDKVMETIKSRFSCPIICDFKPINHSLFHNVFCVTPNLEEAKQLVAPYKHETLFELATKIKQLLKVESVIITLSQDGIYLLDQNDDFCVLGTKTIVGGDVTGAGDTVISTLAACLATGHNLDQSVRLSNLAAAIVVRKTGTAACSIEELQNEINKELM